MALKHKVDDGRRIRQTDVSRLTHDDFRHLASWCDNQPGAWWRPDDGPELTIKQILALYHAANDAGYAGLEEWRLDSHRAATRAWHEVRS